MLFGSLLLPASEQSTILHKCIDWGVRGGEGLGQGGAGCDTFSTFCNQPLCSRLQSAAQRGIYIKIQPAAAFGWIWLHHIVTDSRQNSKSSSPKSL